MKKILIIVVLLVVGGFLFLGRTPDIDDTSPAITVSSTPTNSGATAKINGKILSLIVADTEDTREVGLGGRVSLPEDFGMLFVFDKPDLYEFWMKDMKFPIDIMWLDPNFKVVHVESNITPETYPDSTYINESEALYVLETNANFAQKNNLKIGDVVEVSLNK